MAEKKEKLRYVGNFPPPYGGVTIKNDLLCRKLGEYFDVDIIKSRSKLNQALWLVGCAFTHKKMVVGITGNGFTAGKSYAVTKILYLFNRKRMKSSVYFMMGGTEHKRIEKSRKEIRMYSCYKKIYVELEAMKEALESAGLRNVEVYPNCREYKPFEKTVHSGFRCVFFSLISKSKGADLALAAAEKNPDIAFDFYGHIEEPYAEEFKKNIAALPNAAYKGVFKSNTDNVFAKLAEYDVMLFPTRWKNEGIPGVLAEAKMAGVPVIASDIAFNSLIVHDGVDGLVIKSDCAEELDAAVKALSSDMTLTEALKAGAKANGEDYDVEKYIPKIVSQLRGN